MSSEILNDKALKALNTIGDIMIPAGEGFPSFSAFTRESLFFELLVFALALKALSLSLLPLLLGH